MRFLFLLIGALVFCSPASLLSQQDNADIAAEPPKTQTFSERCELDRQACLQKYPELDFDMMLRFYTEYAPDLVEEWQRRSEESAPENSTVFLYQLAEHFLRLEKVRSRDRRTYERLMEIERTNYKARFISSEIRRLTNLADAELVPELETMRKENLAKAKKDLYALLERSFELSILQQQHEIDELEQGLEALKQKLQQRQENKKRSIEERFQKLTK